MYFLNALALAITAGAALATAIPAELVKRADLKGFDISAAQSSSFWSCTYKAGYRKPVIRGYRQACGVVGSPCLACFPLKVLSKAGNSEYADKTIRISTGRISRSQLPRLVQRS